MKSARSRIKIVILSVTLLIVLLTSVAMVWLSSNKGEHFLGLRLETILSSSLSQPVQLDSLETNIYSRVQIKNIRLLSAVDSTSIVAQISSLRLRYSLLKFLISGLEIDSVLISGLFVDMEHDSLGLFNLNLLNPSPTDSAPGGKAGKPLHLAINYFGLQDGDGTYDDKEIEIGGAVHGLSVLANLDDLSNIEYKLKATSIDFSQHGRAIPLGELALAGSWKSPNLAIDSLSLLSSDLKVSSQGVMSFVEPSPHIQANLKLVASLSALLDTLNSMGVSTMAQAKGEIEITMKLDGSFDAPAIEAKATLSNLKWRQITTRNLSIQAKAISSSNIWTIQTQASLMMQDLNRSYRSANLSSEVMISDSLMELKSFSLSLPDLEVHSKSEFRLTLADMRVQGALALKGSITNAADIIAYFSSPVVEYIEGSVDLNGEINGSIYNPDVHLFGTIPSLKYRKILITDIDLDGRYDRGKLTLAKFEGDLSKGHLSINGDLATSTLQHHLNLKASDIDLYYLWSSVFEVDSPFEGFLNSDISSSGVLSDPSNYTFKARLALDTLEYDGNTLLPFSTVVTSDLGDINLLLTQGDTLIQAHGVMARDSMSGNFQVYLPEIKPYAALFNFNEVSGVLALQGTIGGKYSAPNISAHLNANRLSYKNFPVDSVNSHIHLSDGTLFVEDAFIGGEIAPIDTSHSPFGISGLSGELRYAVDLHGTWADPTVNVSIDVNHFRYQSLNLQSAKVVLDLMDRKISLREFQIVSDSILVSGEGNCALDSVVGNLHFSVTDWMHDSLDIQSVPGQINVAFLSSKGIPHINVTGKSIPVSALGRMIGQTQIGGDLDILLAAQMKKEFQIDSLELRINDLALPPAHLDSLVVKGNMNAREINLTELKGYENGKILEAFAKIARGAKKPDSTWFGENTSITAVSSGRNIDVALVQPFLPESYTIGGMCDLDFELSGKLGHPKANGSLNLRDVNFSTNLENGVFDSIQADIRLNDTLLVINSLSGNYNGLPLAVEAEIKYKNLKQFDLAAKIRVDTIDALNILVHSRGDSIRGDLSMKEFDVALIEPLIPGIDALGGIASAEISVSGTKINPDIVGILQFRELYMSPEALSDSLLNCSLTVKFDKMAIDVTGFYGEYGGGTVTAAGRYAFIGDSLGTKVTLLVKDSRIINTSNYFLTINQTNLSISKSDKFVLIKGDVTLGDSRLLYRFSPQKIISMLRTTDRPKQEQSTFLQMIRLDVKVLDSEELWIDNNLARIKLKADLAVSGILIKPVISGRVSVVEGYALYLDRKFNVEHGVLDFYNPIIINPNIDLLATATIASYKSREETPHTVSLAITGELDQAVVELTSTPPEDRTDIISLLTFGITRRDLTGTDGKEGDVKFQEAVRERLELMTSRRVSGYVSSNVENYLGLQSFTIENNLFQFDKNWGPQLVASKKLSSRTELTFTTTIGRINEQGVKLGYKLTDHLILQGQTEQSGRSGIDLLYKIKLP